MDKTTHNQVRQVLMNELGLSRAFIREEVRRIVSEEVQKALKDGGLERIIGRYVDEYARQWRYSRGAMLDLFQKEVSGAVRDRIMKDAVISVTFKGGRG